MIQEIQSSSYLLQPEHWQSRVSYFLQQRAAVRAGDIAEWLGVEEEIVRCCLARLEQGGQVEVLRPVGRTPGTLPDLDYWRWRTAEDNRYRWQADLHRRRTLSMRYLRVPLIELSA